MLIGSSLLSNSLLGMPTVHLVAWKVILVGQQVCPSKWAVTLATVTLPLTLLMTAAQHSCSSTPLSLLKWLPLAAVCMCSVSFRRSSLCLFVQSSTEVLLHFIGWSCFQAFSATADFSVCPLLQASLCSFNLVSSWRMASPMYTWPQEQGIWYTTMDCFSTGSGSLNLVNKEQKVLPALKATLKSNPLQILLSPCWPVPHREWR